MLFFLETSDLRQSDRHLERFPDPTRRRAALQQVHQHLSDQRIRLGCRAFQPAREAARCDGDAAHFGSGRAPAYKSAIEDKPPEKVDSRVTQQYAKADAHWGARPLEAHHIVEDKTLEKIGAGLNKGAFKRDDAPCVLLVAELHQRLITKELAQRRHLFKGSTSAAARADLVRVYTNIYTDATKTILQQIALKSIDRLIP